MLNSLLLNTNSNQLLDMIGSLHTSIQHQNRTHMISKMQDTRVYSMYSQSMKMSNVSDSNTPYCSVHSEELLVCYQHLLDTCISLVDVDNNSDSSSVIFVVQGITGVYSVNICTQPTCLCPDFDCLCIAPQ